MTPDDDPAPTGAPRRTVSFSNQDRYLHILGSASQVPTEHRNHNGYLFSWFDEGMLFDPGEGIQRQFCRMGLSVSKVSRIFLTHLHGDHCLGLPGLIMRLGLQDCAHPVHLYYPSSGRKFVDALLSCCAYVSRVEVVRHPVDGAATVVETADYSILARPLEHSIDALGWIFQQKPQRRFDKEKLRAAGLENSPLNRDLLRDGAVTVGGRRVALDEVSAVAKGFKLSVLMDTRLFGGCAEFARDADVLLSESTYLDADHRTARENHHLCTTEAARLAKEGGAAQLLLTHFSQRYRDVAPFEAEAKRIFPASLAVEDLMTIRL